ncbi:metallophosphoesterase [Rhizobium sp. SSA_523]|uniref:metallophosphoesterase family protein n=1 Tax=Rhizobium sp. SSA_523 TaxID=2952477 RepID=UPI002091DB41|nr:metallophosphoesterase [Rhizobium sp. SSA_523]MCO5731298.1 metallophosphoesterase [Rhizobium sp. SSA_523]WKC22169.1 metallophosphoesterase [Rhizobium sp. SSA_523]
MGNTGFPPVAIIADAHFHDTQADFGFSGVAINGQRMTLRSWSETRLSTRVFNESAAALREALDRVAERRIRHVVLLGDYSDDGQRGTMQALQDMLTSHSRAYGARFYALPGNHDIFGPQGRHHTKEFLGEGGERLFVTSNGASAGKNTVVSSAMYCEGYPAGLSPMAAFGYFRRADDLHWETPFGASDAVEDRTYSLASPDGRNRYRLMDGSYLVEPEAGLWLLMIDANVFEPVNGHFTAGEEAAFTDSTSGGWNAMLRAKPFMFDWLSDVSRRARAQGKTLLAFSHYPALDPFDGACDAERLLFGDTNVVRRTPVKAVEEALVAAGIAVHFSGHLHVEGVTRRGAGDRTLTNIAVPSLVAFPAAFKILHASARQVDVETVEISDMPFDRRLGQAYALEAQVCGEAADPAFDAEDYGAFLLHHKRALVRHRYFVKEWPAEIVEAISTRNLGEVCASLMAATVGHRGKGKEWSELPMIDLPMIDLIADWYCLRQGASLALPHIAKERLALYRKLADALCLPRDAQLGPVETFLTLFFDTLRRLLDRAESASPRLSLPMVGSGTCVPA